MRDRHGPTWLLVAACALLIYPLMGAKGCPSPAPQPTPPPPVLTCANVDCVPGSHCTETPAGPVCVPDATPPPATGCSIDGEPGPLLPDYRPTLGAEVNAAMATLRPDCPVGGRCVLEESRQAWQARVIAELRRRGVCAGQHAPDTDEIAAATSTTAPREGWHVYVGPEDGPGTVLWSPQAARPAYAAAPAVPPPPASPPGGSCPAPPCPARVWTEATLPDGWGRDMIGKPRWEWSCHESGRAWADCTPVVVRNEPYCASIGMSPMADGSPRAACPMRPDGHLEREAVEWWLVGAPVPDGPDCDPPGRPAYAVPRGSGACRLCDASKTVCSGAW